MADLSKFFKNFEASMGVFHPKDYTIATFPTFEAAKGAYDALRQTGVPDDEVLLATGSEMLAYLKEFREGEGLWGELMRPLSRFIGTEAINADRTVAQAQDGFGFVAIHCLTDEVALKYMETMKPFEPSAADWYLWGGVRSLV